MKTKDIPDLGDVTILDYFFVHAPPAPDSYQVVGDTGIPKAEFPNEMDWNPSERSLLAIYDNVGEWMPKPADQPSARLRDFVARRERARSLEKDYETQRETLRQVTWRWEWARAALRHRKTAHRDIPAC